MQYRIVKREDKTLHKFNYHVQRRTHWWNNWVEVGYPCTTQEAAHILLETYFFEEEIYYTK